VTARSRVLLFGKCGQVGWEVARLLGSRGDIVALDREDVDFAEPAALAAVVAHVAPDVVVNAAAYTAVDRAEREPDLAHAVNAVAPGIIAEASARRGALLVHYSTDYVFDGAADAPYRELDVPAPLSVYGRTKLEGERRIAAVGGRWIVLRTSWVFGSRGQNFLLTMLRLFAEREEVRVVNDQYGAPTSSRFLAEATARVIGSAPGSPLSGVYHCSAGGITTWHGFASLVHALDARPERRCVRVVPVTTTEYPTPAQRPRWSVLDSSRVERTFGIVRRSWNDLVRETMREVMVGEATSEGRNV
jgi:dTDP-4-dehydrorhamnose reductase